MVRVFLAVRTGIGGGGWRGVVGVVRVFAIGLDDPVMVVMGFAIVVVAAAVTAAIRWAMGWALWRTLWWALGRAFGWALWRAFGWTMVFWWARLTRGWTTGSRFGVARGIGRWSTVGMALVVGWVVGWAVRRRRMLFRMRWPTRRYRNRFQAKLLAIARWPREQHPQPQAYVIIRAMRSAEFGRNGAQRRIGQHCIIRNQTAFGRRVIDKHKRFRVPQGLTGHRNTVRGVLFQIHFCIDARCAAALAAGDDQLIGTLASNRDTLVAAPFVPCRRVCWEGNDRGDTGWWMGGGRWMVGRGRHLWIWLICTTERYRF